MLMMQRRNVNWVIKPKNQVRKTWGVTHVLFIIMEEVLLSKVLNIMEKLEEVEGGGYEGSEYFGCHNNVFLILP